MSEWLSPNKQCRPTHSQNAGQGWSERRCPASNTGLTQTLVVERGDGDLDREPDQGVVSTQQAMLNPHRPGGKVEAEPSKQLWPHTGRGGGEG